MIVILIVPKRSSAQLDPPTNKILLNARLKLHHLSFSNNLFIRVNYYLVHLVVLLWWRSDDFSLFLGSCFFYGFFLTGRYFFFDGFGDGLGAGFQRSVISSSRNICTFIMPSFPMALFISITLSLNPLITMLLRLFINL